MCPSLIRNNSIPSIDLVDKPVANLAELKTSESAPQCKCNFNLKIRESEVIWVAV